MAADTTATPRGGHYSGTNRIPNIKQFMDNLDREKKDRDAKIDSTSKDKAEVRAHRSGAQKQGNNRRTVRDPVTGQDVEIDDVDAATVAAAKDPQVS